ARQHSIAATEALLAIEIPTIASVHGFALGGGLELALTCDIIVADHSAILGLPETGVGIIPGGGGTQLLTRRVGLSRASELIFTGRKIDAETAHDYGLVDILAATDQSAYEAAEELARLITCNSPVSVRNAKAALRGGIGLPLWEGLALEDTRWRASALSTDYREGLAAFLERRAPSWPG
ncbi:enoyl-CoA hydratase/isomerase family protein, partial [Rhodococcus koreensis]